MRGYTLFPIILMALLPVVPGFSASSARIRLILLSGSALQDRRGLLRQIESLRRADNGDVSVVVYHGPLMTLESGWGGPHVLKSFLDSVGCVAVIPTGMDWGREAGLLPHLAEGLGRPVVVANVFQGESAGRWPDNIVKACVVTAGASRVSICGVVNRTAGLWQLPEYPPLVRIQDEDLALLDVAHSVRRAGAQVTLLFVEKDLRWSGGPYGELDRLAEMFPYFDLVVGTHGWRSLGLRWLGDSLYLQPGRHHIMVVDIRTTEGTQGRPRPWARIKRIRLEPALEADTTAEIHTFMQRMLEAAGADVALYPHRGSLYGRRAGRGFWLVDGSRICIMKVPYSRLRRLARKWGRAKGLWWCSEGIPELDSFSYRRKGYSSRFHPRRKIRICMTARLAASFGGRFRFLRELAQDPRSELEVCRISAADLYFEGSRDIGRANGE